uniref:CSON000551 protein n=1 Tax=Culicoides sonorensis TaxID=179676 RepID=A0A336LT67_CULSO
MSSQIVHQHNKGEVYIIKELQQHHPDDEMDHQKTSQSSLEDDLQASNSGNTVTIMDHDEKRMRRQIANSNERRRMQSINAGFQSLRNLLPHHEGEKLSKASILQQTAEYIYNLEQEKARLLNQNCQLKRLLDQHDPGSAAAVTADFGTTTTQTTTGTTVLTTKKRKLEGGQIVVQAVSDSSDEGLGSMSPEPVPVTILSVLPQQGGKPGSATTTAATTTLPGNATLQISAKDYIDMKRELERERKQRFELEKQIRSNQIYSDRVHYQEVIDHTDNVREEDIIMEHGNMTLAQMKSADGTMENVQVLSLDSIPSVGQTQVVVCSPVGDLIEENSRPISPSDLMRTDEPLKHENIIITTSGTNKKPRIVSSILEAAIKAEPKVEVERIEAPSTIVIEDGSKSSRSRGSPAPANCMYVTNTSRQNLQAIVAAIEHLEGEHYVEKVVEQEAPLALTNKQIAVRDREHRKIHSEIQPFLKFKQVTVATSSPGQTVTVQTTPGANHVLKSTICNIQQQQMSRPGVIVVKHQKN